jgi:hypothetical protein
MKQKQSSTTAEGMALVRAIEASRPPDKRICYDPIARALVNPISVFLSKLVIDSGIYDRLFAPGVGAIEFITARERYIDDFLKARLSEGLDQVVILGAGHGPRGVPRTVRRGAYPRGAGKDDSLCFGGRHARRRRKLVRSRWLSAAGSTLLSTAVRHTFVPE